MDAEQPLAADQEMPGSARNQGAFAGQLARAINVERIGGRILGVRCDRAAVEDIIGAEMHHEEVSLRGDIDCRDLAETKIDIFPSVPVFELTMPPNSCVNRINLRPIGITLAPMINQIELRGSVFDGGWTMTSRQTAITVLGPIPSEATKIPLCLSEKPAQQSFTFGLHPKPTPAPKRPIKKSKRL